MEEEFRMGAPKSCNDSPSFNKAGYLLLSLPKGRERRDAQCSIEKKPLRTPWQVQPRRMQDLVTILNFQTGTHQFIKVYVQLSYILIYGGVDDKVQNN